MPTHRFIAQPSTSGMPGLCGLIDDLGMPSFPGTLFRTTLDWTKASHLTAFAFESGHSPRVIFAENAGTTPIAREVADQYCRDYWRHDLAGRIMRGTDPADGGGISILHTRASEIAHSDYRRYCYTAVCLDHRVSLIDVRGDRTLRINLYRTRGDAFTDEDIQHIADRAGLLLALTRRHADYGVISRQNSLGYYRDRLTVVAPMLTPRETEVGAAIILGLTSEGIALELGISLNTVLTYKKRAYARLGISSQNELLRLVLN
jgi:LuxR family transcriptional regulator, activator of tox operons